MIVKGIEKIKTEILSGLVWSFGERITAQAVSFIVSIILARILDPEHYGVIAIVTIFITIFNVFVTSGLGSALIQKKTADELDFSTIFYSGLVFAIVLYGFLFLCAPVVAEFYTMPELTDLLRVLGLRLPIASINTVQHAYVSKHLIFKKFFFSTLFGTIISAGVGIFMAYKGFGAWSLVFQYLTNTTIDTLVLFVTLPWKPQLKFSFERFKGLYKYGWKILLSDLIQTIYNDLRGLAIGKKYTSSDLAYYNRGQQFTSIIVVNIESSIIKVLFPAISTVQDDIEAVKNMTRRAIKIASFIMSPLLIGLAVVAKPIVFLLLTEKWLPTVPYLQVLCVANLFQPMHAANLQAIKALGRSDINLKLEIIKKCYSIIILLITLLLFNDPFAVVVGFAISTFISIIVNGIPNKKLLKYGYFEQLKDIAPHLIISCVMGGIVYLVGMLNLPEIIILVIQVIVGFLVYVAISAKIKVESYTYIINLFKSLLNKRTKRIKKTESENV